MEKRGPRTKSAKELYFEFRPIKLIFDTTIDNARKNQYSTKSFIFNEWEHTSSFLQYASRKLNKDQVVFNKIFDDLYLKIKRDNTFLAHLRVNIRDLLQNVNHIDYIFKKLEE